MSKDPFYLRYFDIFGVAPSLSFKNQSHVHSYFGFYLSLILLGVGAYTIYFFGENMFQKTNPTIVQSEQPGRLFSEIIRVPEQQILIGVQSNETGRHYIDPSVYTVVVKTNSDLGMTIEATPCLPTNVSIRFGVTENLWCFKSPEGYLPARGFNSVTMYLSKCTNGSSQVCKDPDEIDAILQNSFVNVYWNDVSLDSYDYKNPIKNFLSIYTYTLLKNLSPRLDVVYRAIEVSTDSGYLYEETETLNTVGVDYPFYTVADPYLNNNAVFVLSLASVGRLTALTRRYQKVQDLIAQVLAVVNIFLIIFQLFAKRYTESQMYAAISNEVMEIVTTSARSKTKLDPACKIIKHPCNDDTSKIEQPNKGSKKKEAKKEKNVKSVNLKVTDEQSQPTNTLVSPKNMINSMPPIHSSQHFDQTYNLYNIAGDASISISDSEDNISQQESEPKIAKSATKHEDVILPDFLPLKTEKLSICFSTWVASLFKANEDTRKINLLKDHVDAGMDITTIFMKLNEIERLKEILLTDDQRYLFNKLRKPQARFIPEKGKLELELINNDEYQFASCKDAFNKMLKRDKLKLVDRNLIKMAHLVYDH